MVFNLNFYSTGNDHGAILKIGKVATRQNAANRVVSFFFSLKDKKVGIANYRAWHLWRYTS